MADCKAKSITGQIQLLMDTEPDFPERFMERLLFESSKVANPFKFIARLCAKGVLFDGSDESASEVNLVLKKRMVQLALMIACSRGAEEVGGLMDALKESGNSEFVSALGTWIMTDLPAQSDGALSEHKDDRDLSVVPTATREFLGEQVKNSIEFSSIATKLIDRIMSHEEKDFMEQLEAQLVGKAPEIVNAAGFLSDLEHQNILDESDQQLKSGPEAHEEQLTARAMKVARSTKAIGTLIAAFKNSGNEHILQETFECLETSEARRKNYPIAVKSLAGRPIDEKSNLVRSAFFQQAAPLDGLEKVATFNCQPEASMTGTFALTFNRYEMIVNLADGTVKLWNWRENEEKTFEFGAKVKEITCMEYDKEVCVLGTATGSVYLFDAVALEAKWFIRLGEPVQSLKFVETTLAVVTRGARNTHFWWIDISRADMRLLNKRLVLTGGNAENAAVCINPDCSFLSCSDFAYAYDTKSGRPKMDMGRGCSLKAPDHINVLNVVDLITLKKIVLTGCNSGVIAMWNDGGFGFQQIPIKTFQGQMEAIVTLCSLNGHLLSVDKSGKLLMWSGYDLETKNGVPPAPQVLADNFYNVNCLVAHDRWFATSSTENGTVDIWTLPDLWLLCG